ncbi:MAG: hypothetical protein JST01_03990 [Cyanobacteria bacterium SZAS TMP-1]|nr:hypothetical protein [Cyanobacteria bacterium SZAS TMP-1]
MFFLPDYLKRLPRRSFSMLGTTLAALLLTAGAAMADEQGWVLTQRSDKIGDQYVYVAPNGVKLVNPKIGYNIVLCAPDWNVCIYNDKTKTFYSASYASWMQEVDKAMGTRGTELKGGRWAKSSGASICGLKATSYIMQGSPNRHLRNATCWVSNDIQVPYQITDLLAKTYGLPDNKAYPLKLNTVDNAGHLSVQLDTYNSQACAIPASYFYLPNGYTRVASKEEVMVDDDTKAILRDLASDSPSMSGSSSSSSYNSRPQQQVVRQQQTYQQQVQPQQIQSQYQQPTQAAQPAQPQQSPYPTSVKPGDIMLPNGQTVTLDKEKVRRIIEALKNSGKTPQTTPTTP